MATTPLDDARRLVAEARVADEAGDASQAYAKYTIGLARDCVPSMAVDAVSPILIALPLSCRRRTWPR